VGVVLARRCERNYASSVFVEDTVLQSDGIDNDGDWDPLNDDVGLDGNFGTFDTGEADGLPTSGRGTDAPGEPHIDKTDVSESDQLGLTSFYYFRVFVIT
jgi:hypothetical protein